MTANPLARILDGKALAAHIRADLATKTQALKAKHGITPGIAVLLVGEDPASQIYVRNKGETTLRAGGRTLHLEAAAYANRVHGFIYLRPTAPVLTIRGVFPGFRYAQTDAQLRGAELTTSWTPFAQERRTPRSQASSASTRATAAAYGLCV